MIMIASAMSEIVLSKCIAYLGPQTNEIFVGYLRAEKYVRYATFLIDKIDHALIDWDRSFANQVIDSGI